MEVMINIVRDICQARTQSQRKWGVCKGATYSGESESSKKKPDSGMITAPVSGVLTIDDDEDADMTVEVAADTDANSSRACGGSCGWSVSRCSVAAATCLRGAG